MHRFLEEFKRCLAIKRLGDVAFQDLTFVIYSPPKVLRHPVDFQIDLIQVPLPVAMRAHRLSTLLSDLGGEHRTKPVPPVSHHFVADFDATLIDQVLDIAEGKREPDA